MSPRVVVGRLLTLGALLVALGAPAIARELTITAEPGLGTWHDTVTIRVAGVSNTPCGAAAVTLTMPQVVPDPSRVLMELREPCGATGDVLAQPFDFERALVHPAPADYTVVVEDVDRALHTAPFRVLDEGTQHLDVAAPATEAAPVTVRIRGFGCPNPRPPQVDGSAVTLTMDSYCYSDTFAQQPEAFELEQEVGPLTAGVYELRLVDTKPSGPSLVRESLTVTREGGCIASGTSLCLAGGRFEATATWAVPGFHPPNGVAGATPIPGNDGSGLLWFFSPDNAELTVKILDGCPVNGRWWVFIASGSDVHYELRVRDTRGGTTKTYTHQAGSLPPLVTDVSAFADCSP